MWSDQLRNRFTAHYRISDPEIVLQSVNNRPLKEFPNSVE